MNRTISLNNLSDAKKHLSQADERLSNWIRQAKLLPMARSAQSPYERLARAIVGQQISVAAAQTIWLRFCDLFEDQTVNFARLSELETAVLRSVGLSKQKIGYLRDLAQKVTSGTVPKATKLMKFDDEKIMQTLLPIKGVGEWTVQMLLIFHLQRPDVWPIKDLGIKRGFMKVHNKRKIPDEKFLLKFGEKFRPYRSYAALYYWKALDNNGGA